MESTFGNGSQELWEYLLVVHPDENVGKKIMDEKKSFFEAYNQKIDIKTKPHITIANFLATESMEETVIRWIHRICGHYKSFPVTLNNYSGFPSHSIYVRIQDHAPFKQLASELEAIDQYVRLNGRPPARLIARPHLTIARR